MVYPLSDAIDIPDWNLYTDSQKLDEIQKMKTYAAMIKMADIQIGKLIDYLENTNQRDNTLILIASDNGASAELEDFGDGEIGDLDKFITTGLPWAVVSNTPFRKWKKTNYEGGIHSPLIVNWPQGLVNPGRIETNKLHFIDLMPTLINVCNANYKFKVNGEYVTAMQGEDFSNVFEDIYLPERERPLFFKWENQEAMIYDNKKLVYNPGPQVWDFYDLEINATETSNLKNDEPLMVQNYLNEYNKWFAGVTQLSPVAIADTLDAVYSKVSLLDIFSNDFDDDSAIDFSKTIITKQPNSGIISFIDDSLLYYQHYQEDYLTDTFEYVIYDSFEAFSQASQVIVNICNVADSCALLLDEQDLNFRDENYRIFPNPVFTDFVLFVYNNPPISIDDISIYDVAGKQLNNFQIETLTENKFKININDFEEGYYVVTTPSKSLKILKVEN